MLNSVVVLTKNVDNLDSNLSTFGTRLDQIGNTFIDKINEIEN